MTDKKASTPKAWNSRPIWTEDTFDYATAAVGDYVTQAVVDNAMNCLPPACMTSSCAQMGEPYSHRRDPDSDQWRPTYATFRRATSSPDGLWMYCGHCFQGENRERGADLAASAALPEWCYSTLLDTGMVIILKRGETGYYKTDIPFTSKENARVLADEYNRRMGVTKAQEAAMSAGSMFGFHVPGADPSNYDENGKPVRPPGGHGTNT